MLVMRALATTLAGLTVAAGVITAPFEQQLRTVARVQDGARNVADVTFDVTYSKGRQRRHTLKFADIALSPKAGWYVTADHIGKDRSQLFNTKDLDKLPRKNKYALPWRDWLIL